MRAHSGAGSSSTPHPAAVAARRSPRSPGTSSSVTPGSRRRPFSVATTAAERLCDPAVARRTRPRRARRALCKRAPPPPQRHVRRDRDHEVPPVRGPPLVSHRTAHERPRKQLDREREPGPCRPRAAFMPPTPPPHEDREHASSVHCHSGAETGSPAPFCVSLNNRNGPGPSMTAAGSAAPPRVPPPPGPAAPRRREQRHTPVVGAPATSYAQPGGSFSPAARAMCTPVLARTSASKTWSNRRLEQLPYRAHRRVRSPTSRNQLRQGRGPRRGTQTQRG